MSRDDRVTAAEGTAERQHVRPKPYVSVAELARLTPGSEDAIRAMVARGSFRRGVHYFQPAGHRGQLVFRWDAVVLYIEGGSGHEGIPLADGTVIDLEEAQKQARRLLG